MKGWIGVDLDGTLAFYDGWKGVDHIGPPVESMLKRVLKWIEEGKTVKIFTARVAVPEEHLELVVKPIKDWCVDHIGVELEVTCQKDMMMVELWDDRCVQVVPNFGIRADGKAER